MMSGINTQIFLPTASEVDKYYRSTNLYRGQNKLATPEIKAMDGISVLVHI